MGCKLPKIYNVLSAAAEGDVFGAGGVGRDAGPLGACMHKEGDRVVANADAKAALAGAVGVDGVRRIGGSDDVDTRGGDVIRSTYGGTEGRTALEVPQQLDLFGSVAGSGAAVSRAKVDDFLSDVETDRQ